MWQNLAVLSCGSNRRAPPLLVQSQIRLPIRRPSPLLAQARARLGLCLVPARVAPHAPTTKTTARAPSPLRGPFPPSCAACSSWRMACRHCSPLPPPRTPPRHRAPPPDHDGGSRLGTSQVP